MNRLECLGKYTIINIKLILLKQYVHCKPMYSVHCTLYVGLRVIHSICLNQEGEILSLD